MKSKTILFVTAGGAVALGLCWYYVQRGRVTLTPKDPNIYVLEGGDVEVHVSAFGATITKIMVPDRNGIKD
eukprot:7056829-Pyramimonas_sp.AAC.1